jgi:hypothetical protein
VAGRGPAALPGPASQPAAPSPRPSAARVPAERSRRKKPLKKRLRRRPRKPNPPVAAKVDGNQRRSRLVAAASRSGLRRTATAPSATLRRLASWISRTLQHGAMMIGEHPRVVHPVLLHELDHLERAPPAADGGQRRRSRTVSPPSRCLGIAAIVFEEPGRPKRQRRRAQAERFPQPQGQGLPSPNEPSVSIRASSQPATSSRAGSKSRSTCRSPLRREDRYSWRSASIGSTAVARRAGR